MVRPNGLALLGSVVIGDHPALSDLKIQSSWLGPAFFMDPTSLSSYNVYVTG